MLVRFRFGNFRCFKEDQELSLVAAKKSAATVAVERPKLDLLRAAAIFGANASGKSSVLQALGFARYAITESFQSWLEGSIPVEPYALSNDEPTWFEIVFSLNGVLYDYSFKVDRLRVLEERLMGSVGRKYLLYERGLSEAGEPTFTFGPKLRGRNRTIAEVTRPNCLFLSAAAAHRHEELSGIREWFSKNILFAGNPDREDRLLFTVLSLQKEETKEQVLELVQRADFAIQRLLVREIEGDSRVDQARRSKQMELVSIHRVQEGEFELPFASESEGTQSWLALAGPILFALETGKLLCVDELDSSLHPLLVREIVRMFQDPEQNPKNAQLIFNTHDSSLLGNFPGGTPLSRDEVWFTERLPEGGSKLFPLSDFETKKDDNLERRYLLGRYGALPDLRLFEVEVS